MVLTDGWKYELARVRKKILSAKGREKYKSTVGRPSEESLSIIDNDLPKHNTRETIADDLGWSTGKLAQGGHTHYR